MRILKCGLAAARVNSGARAKYRCPAPGCPYVCSTSPRLVNHIESAHENDRHLEVYLKSAKEQRPFKCPEEGCGAAFRGLETLKDHIRKNHHHHHQHPPQILVIDEADDGSGEEEEAPAPKTATVWGECWLGECEGARLINAKDLQAHAPLHKGYEYRCRSCDASGMRSWRKLRDHHTKDCAIGETAAARDGYILKIEPGSCVQRAAARAEQPAAGAAEPQPSPPPSPRKGKKLPAALREPLALAPPAPAPSPPRSPRKGKKLPAAAPLREPAPAAPPLARAAAPVLAPPAPAVLTLEERLAADQREEARLASDAKALAERAAQLKAKNEARQAALTKRAQVLAELAPVEADENRLRQELA